MSSPEILLTKRQYYGSAKLDGDNATLRPRKMYRRPTSGFSAICCTRLTQLPENNVREQFGFNNCQIREIFTMKYVTVLVGRCSPPLRSVVRVFLFPDQPKCLRHGRHYLNITLQNGRRRLAYFFSSASSLINFEFCNIYLHYSPYPG